MTKYVAKIKEQDGLFTARVVRVDSDGSEWATRFDKGPFKTEKGAINSTNKYINKITA